MADTPSRDRAVALAAEMFSSGAFFANLASKVALPTESQQPGRETELLGYLEGYIAPDLAELGFSSRVIENSVPGRGPFLIATRIEDVALPTILIYGHGDVVMGNPNDWREGLSPWTLTEVGERWYGRGAADNKGQHAINIAALAAVHKARGGSLGFNTKILIEMGEEAGSPGLHALARSESAALKADVLIASDGPRLSAERPTVFLGSRGAINVDLTVNLREGGHHSGNWGGLLANPGTILANAIASLVDKNGVILVEALRPKELPAAVREALSDIHLAPGPSDPHIDRDWGEPGLTPEERVFGWNALEVLAFETGNPKSPLNAVPPQAKATIQLRFVVGTDGKKVVEAIQAHLDALGMSQVKATSARMDIFAATRLDPTDPWVGWALASIARTTGKKPALLPNLGGSIPNDAFSEILGLPTLWVPHSYPGCSQHAPNEHMLASVVEEGLRLMAGLFFDLGEDGQAVKASRKA